MTAFHYLASIPFVSVVPVFAKHGNKSASDGDEDEDDENDNDSDEDNNNGDNEEDNQDTVRSGSVSSLNPTQTNSAPPSSTSTSLSSPDLQFIPPSNVTVCGSTTFRWNYNGTEDIALTIAVTNERSSQLASQQSNETMLISRTLTNTVSSNAKGMAWSRADVPAGAYVVLAFDTEQGSGLHAQSPPFFVVASTDMGCLTPTSITSPPSPTKSSNASSQDTGTASPAPVQLQSQGKALSTGALAGTVIGVVVGVLLLLLAFNFPHFWRHSLPRRARRPGGPYLLF
ncbi:unnamed protein product [Somion occarium]|uniref:Uncharacterized protein n=1 Tax=Somion occarium TaxID=3059160 RepID=A0ABP1D6P5_9APHY